MTKSADQCYPTVGLLAIFWDHCQWFYRAPLAPTWLVDHICQLWLTPNIGQVRRYIFLGANCQRDAL